MKHTYSEPPNGYLESIQKGMDSLKYFRGSMSAGNGGKAENIEKLREAIAEAEAIVIGAGAGLSTSAGFSYSGERFRRYFFDFAERFGITDMYSGGFYPFPDVGTRWAWWARHIYFNRYVNAPKSVYNALLALVKEADYFVITTNVDHQFQRAGFDKKRLFYTQGDYGLFQSVNPAVKKTYDNEKWVTRAMMAQGFVQNENGEFAVPEDRALAMTLPADLIPKCPDDGSDVTMNLRADDSFVEDEGWHRASAAYSDFLRGRDNRYVLYLELGVGANTPVIIKYPFWQMTRENENAVYACVNVGNAYCPEEIQDRSICVDDDIGDVLAMLQS